MERVAIEHSAVADVAVIPDDRWGEAVKAIVVPAEGAEVDADNLIAFCRARLAHYKCPTSVEFEGGLALTATGKVQKLELRAPYWQGRQRSSTETVAQTVCRRNPESCGHREALIARERLTTVLVSASVAG